MAVIFLKIEAKNIGEPIGSARLFNEDIWKKNHISLSSLSSQSTSL